MAKDDLRVSDVVVPCRSLLMVSAFFHTNICAAASTAKYCIRICPAQDLAAAIRTFEYKLNTEELEAIALVSGGGPQCANWLRTIECQQ